MSQDSTAARRVLDAFDVSDENPEVIANHLKALAREVRAGFEMLTEEIKNLRRTIDQRDNNTKDEITAIKRQLERPTRKAQKK